MICVFPPPHILTNGDFRFGVQSYSKMTEPGPPALHLLGLKEKSLKRESIFGLAPNIG